MGRVESKVAVVTGAASGLGEADARLMAKEGAKVVVTTSRKLDQGRRVADEIRKEGGEAIFLKLDVTQESDWQEVISEVIKKYGKLNILVNNAGIAVPGKIEELSLNDWSLHMNVNSTGIYWGTKYAINAMKNNGELCSIINIVSVNALIGMPDFIAYDASKGAVRAFSRTAALHCCEAGYTIRVNSVYPGVIHTPMIDQEAKDQGVTIEQYLEEYVKLHPIGHVGEPNDIAYAVLYLASDESKFVTGSELVVDGGWTAR